jgi:hypothetical protein
LLLTDITENELSSSIAENLNANYLEPATEFPGYFPVAGKIYGYNKRLMVSLPCRMVGQNSRAINIIFLVDTGSPISYICEKAIEALIQAPGSNIPARVAVKINSSRAIYCNLSPLDSHFADVNVLGMDFLCTNKVSPIINVDDLTFRLAGNGSATNEQG